MQTWARKDQWAGSAPTVATGRRGHTGGPAQCSATCAVKAEKSGPQGALSRKGDLPRRLHPRPTTVRAGARRALLRPMLGTEVTRAPPDGDSRALHGRRALGAACELRPSIARH